MIGKLFNYLYSKRFYKIFNLNLKHKNYVYTIGRNKDVQKVTKKNNMGFHFTTASGLFNFGGFRNMFGVVEICNTSRVYVNSEVSFRTNLIDVVNVYNNFHDFINSSPEICIDIVSSFPPAARFINNKFYGHYASFIKKNPLIIKYIYDPFKYNTYETPNTDINIADVKSNPILLLEINTVPKELYSELFKVNPMLLAFIGKQTEDMCMVAVSHWGMALQYVAHQTNNVCLRAVTQTGCALQFVKDKTNDICIAAVKNDGMAIQYISNPTDEMRIAAIHQNPYALHFINKQ